MKKGLLVMLAVLIFLSACGNSGSTDQGEKLNDQRDGKFISVPWTVTDSEGKTVLEYIYGEDGAPHQINTSEDVENITFTFEMDANTRSFDVTIDGICPFGLYREIKISYLCNTAGQPEKGTVRCVSENKEESVMGTFEHWYNDDGLLQSITFEASHCLSF
ncbi:MAG: hypothetical protein ACI3XD_10050 [Oscillospiraceae bacterium]